MKSARLLTLALLSCAAAAGAQSTTQPAPQPSAPVMHDSRNQVPAVSPSTVVVKPASVIAQNDSVCYALRTYQFTPTERASGATSYKGQSTCVPAHSANAMIVVAKPK
jgi:hypothetical protein